MMLCLLYCPVDDLATPGCPEDKVSGGDAWVEPGDTMPRARVPVDRQKYILYFDFNHLGNEL